MYFVYKIRTYRIHILMVCESVFYASKKSNLINRNRSVTQLIYGKYRQSKDIKGICEMITLTLKMPYISNKQHMK